MDSPSIQTEVTRSGFDERKVGWEKAYAVAKQHGIPYLEVSAKSRQNTREALSELVRQITQHEQQEESKEQESPLFLRLKQNSEAKQCVI